MNAIRPNKSAPSVYIVILNWNGKEDTIECLDSVFNINYSNFDVIVVDNGSADGSVDAIQARFSDIKIIETGNNLGYAGGNNFGIRYALENGADYILLLNNDTRVSDDLLSIFVEASLDGRKEDILGPNIYHYSEPERLWCSANKWNNKLGRFDRVLLHKNDGIHETSYVNGCAIFMPASVLRRVGLLDEDFFLTYEETDWCYRARKSGHNCYIVPSATLLHKVSASIGGSDSPLACYFWVRNQLAWARRHLDAKGRYAVWRSVFYRIYSAFVPSITFETSGSLPKRVLWSGLTWLRNLNSSINSKTNRAMLIGLHHYFKKRMGDCPENIRRWTETAISVKQECHSANHMG